MTAKRENGFSIGKLTGLDWQEICGHAAEVAREDGDVYYRGRFVCTVFNDDGGGDTLNEAGEPITDAQVQAAIDEIDSTCEN